MPCKISSTVGIGYRSLTIASLALLISKHILISLSGFGIITTGFTQGVGPLTLSIMSRSINSFIFFSTASLRLYGILLSGCATGLTCGSMYSVICLVFNFPTPLKTFGYCCLSESLMFVTTDTFSPIFNTPSFIAVFLPSSGSPLPLITMNSACSDLLPMVISHSNIPLIASGSLEEYEYKFLCSLGTYE